MHSPHLPFNVSVSVFCILLIALFIPNIYYYENIYSNGGTSSMGKNSAMVMIVLNIIALIVSALILLWSSMKFFEDHTSHGSKSYSGFKF